MLKNINFSSTEKVLLKRADIVVSIASKIEFDRANSQLLQRIHKILTPDGAYYLGIQAEESRQISYMTTDPRVSFRKRKKIYHLPLGQISLRSMAKFIYLKLFKSKRFN